jgi:hypothetical protein
MIKARDEWTTVYGGPGSSWTTSGNPYWESNFPNLRSEKRKEKIKKLFKL